MLPVRSRHAYLVACMLSLTGCDSAVSAISAASDVANAIASEAKDPAEPDAEELYGFTGGSKNLDAALERYMKGVKKVQVDPSAGGRPGSKFNLAILAAKNKEVVSPFTWTATGGTLSKTRGAVIDWTSPTTPGNYKVTVQIKGRVAVPYKETWTFVVTANHVEPHRGDYTPPAAPPSPTPPTPRPDAGTTTTLAGGGFADWVDGPTGTSRLNAPSGLVLDGAGNMIIADTDNHVIRKLTPQGQLTTIAGDGRSGNQDGAARQARFKEPRGVAVDARGNIYVADTGNDVIRKLGTDGRVTTFAGDGEAALVFDNNSDDGQGTSAEFHRPWGICYDATSDSLYVADTANHLVRRIDMQANVTTIMGQRPTLAGLFDGMLVGMYEYHYGHVGGFISEALLNDPFVIAAGSDGAVYIGERQVIRKISKRSGSWHCATVAGRYEETADGWYGATRDGLGVSAKLKRPNGMFWGKDGKLYFTDDNTIKTLAPDGLVATVIKSYTGFSDGRTGSAGFQGMAGLAIAADQTFYVADAGNNRIRKVVR